MELGSKLTSYPYPYGFTADDWDGVIATLSQFKMPYKLLGFAVDKGKFHVLISSTKRIRIISKTEIQNS